MGAINHFPWCGVPANHQAGDCPTFFEPDVSGPIQQFCNSPFYSGDCTREPFHHGAHKNAKGDGWSRQRENRGSACGACNGFGYTSERPDEKCIRCGGSGSKSDEVRAIVADQEAERARRVSRRLCRTCGRPAAPWSRETLAAGWCTFSDTSYSCGKPLFDDCEDRRLPAIATTTTTPEDSR